MAYFSTSDFSNVYSFWGGHLKVRPIVKLVLDKKILLVTRSSSEYGHDLIYTDSNTSSA
jgi:hypothetical protein